MIVLKADKELNLTFQKLIKMMDAPVEWNGMFFVVGDYLILQGSVRSLFFNFDTKLVVTNIIELKAEEQMIAAVEQHPNVRDILNMVLYAFGKWGNIKGLRVDKDYVQLNRLFAQILGEFQVESQYGPEHFRFYKNKIRLTYEDVIEAVLSDEPEEVLLPEEEEPQGLWHKLVWKKAASSFLMRDTTLAERRRNRIGNTFIWPDICARSVEASFTWQFTRKAGNFRLRQKRGQSALPAFTAVKSAVACIRQDQSVCWWMGMYTKWTLSGMRLPMRIIRNFWDVLPDGM